MRHAREDRAGNVRFPQQVAEHPTQKQLSGTALRAGSALSAGRLHCAHRAQAEAADRFDQLLALLRIATAGGDRPDQGFGKRADDAGRGGIQRLLRELPSRHTFRKQLAKNLPEQAPATDTRGVHLALYRLGDKGVGQRWASRARRTKVAIALRKRPAALA